MLRRICGKCGEIIDGEPLIEKDYADAVLVLDDEIAAMYDDLCPNCKKALRNAFSNFLEDAEEVRVPEPPDVAPDVSRTDWSSTSTGGEVVDVEVPKRGPDEPVFVGESQHRPFEEVDKDALPNQVTKQFPINIQERARGTSSR